MKLSDRGQSPEATAEQRRVREYMRYVMQLSDDQPLFSNMKFRPSRQFLRQAHDIPWGFVIYRTVYGPGSEASLALVLEKIKQHVINMVYFEEWSATQLGRTIDITPIQQIIDTYQPEIRQGPEFDSASDATIRAHFDASIRKLERNMDNDRIDFERFNDGGHVGGCIVLDEESLESIINGTNPVPGFLYQDNVELGEFKMLDRGHTSVRVRCDHVWCLYDNLMRRNGLVDYTRFDGHRDMVVFDFH